MYWYSIYYLAVLFLEAFKRNYKSQIKIIYICPELIDFWFLVKVMPRWFGFWRGFFGWL